MAKTSANRIEQLKGMARNHNSEDRFEDLKDRARTGRGIDYGVDDNYINSYIQDYQNMLNNFQNDYSNNSYGTASNNASKYADINRDLQSRAKKINTYLIGNKPNIDPETYNDLVDFVKKSYVSTNDVNRAFGDASNYYSQFKNEDDYTKASIGWYGDNDTTPERVQSRRDYYSKNEDKIKELNSQLANAYNSALAFGDDGIAASSSPEVRSILNQINNLQSENRMYDITQGVTDKYFDLTQQKDFGSKSANRAFKNASRAELDAWDKTITNWNIEHESVAYYDDNGKPRDSRGNLVETEQPEMPEVQDKLGLFQSASATDISNAYNTISGNTAGYTLPYESILKEGETNNWTELTDEETAMYYYLLNTQGKSSAYKYLDELGPTLGKRSEEGMNSIIDEASGLEKVLMNAASVPANVYGGVAGAIGDAADLIQGKEYNPYSAAHRLSSFAQGVRSVTSEDINEALGDGQFLGMQWGDVYQSLMSGADSLFGGLTVGSGYEALMGLSSAENEARKLYEEGASAQQIASQALASGIMEVIGEHWVYGKFSENYLDEINVSNIKTYLEKFLKSAYNEGLEEVVTDIGTLITDAITRTSKSEIARYVNNYIDQGYSNGEAFAQAFIHDILPQFGVDFLGGAISGGAMAAGGSAVSLNKYNNYTRNVGLGINAQGNVGDLINQAQGTVNLSNADTKQMQKYIDIINNTEAGQKGNKYYKAVGKLYEQVQTGNVNKFKTANTDATRQAFEEVLKTMSDVENADVNKIANVFSKQLAGKKLSLSESRILKNNQSAYDDIVKSEDFDSKVEEYTQNRQMQSYRDYAMTSGLPQVASVNSANIDVENEVSENGKTINANNGDEVKVSSVDSIRKVGGEMVMNLKLSDGSIVNSNDIKYANEDTAYVYEFIKQSGFSANTANQVLAAYENSDLPAQQFMNGVAEAYTYGFTNYNTENLKSYGFFGDLTPAMQKFAYNLGKEDSYAKFKTAQNIKKALKSNSARQGKVHTEGISSSLSARQSKSIAAIGDVEAAITHNDVYFFESEKDENGHYVVKNSTGSLKAGDSAPNGLYADGKGDVYIDVNAGNLGEGTILYTAGHEFTHFIQEWSPAKYQALADFLIEQYKGKGVDINKLISDQINKAERNGHKLTRSEAFDEIVADSMSEMFADERFGEKLAELKKRDNSLVAKLKEFLENLANKIRDVAKLYKGDASTEEARLVRTMGDAVDHLLDLYTEALVDAGETYAKSTENVSNGDLYSIREDLIDDLNKVKNNTFDSKLGEIVVGNTSDFLKNIIGVADIRTVIAPKKAYAAMVSEDVAKAENRYDPDLHYHNLGAKGVIDALTAAEDPLFAYTNEDGRIILVTEKSAIDEETGKHAQTLVVCDIEQNALVQGKWYDANRDITIYAKSKIKDDLNYAIKNGGILYATKKGSQVIPGVEGIQFPNSLDSISFDNNINQFMGNVKIAKGAKLARDSQGKSAMEIALEKAKKKAQSPSSVKRSDRVSQVISSADTFNELFTESKGKISVNVADVSTEDWNMIAKAVRKAGYTDITSGKIAKEVYSRYTNNGIYTFNEGQSNAIRQTYGMTQGSASANPQRALAAKKYFGITNDFREAGYLLPDGSMLDFSGKKFGGPRGMRTMDHREIAPIFNDEEVNDNGGASAYMNAFISEGNIRLMESQGITIGELEPTPAQYSLLKKFIDHVLKEEDYFYLDLSNNAGNTIESRDYDENDSASKIINDIRAFYKNGELPYRSELNQFRFSIREDAIAQIDKALQDKNYDEEVILTDESPSIIVSQKGAKNYPLVMKASHIRSNILTTEEAKELGISINKGDNFHGLGKDIYIKVIDGLNDVELAYRGTKNASDPARRENYFLLISKVRDGENLINVPVFINEKARKNNVFIDINKVATMFGRDNFNLYIQKEIRNGNLVRIKNKKGSSQTGESKALIAVDYGMDSSNGSLKTSERANEKLADYGERSSANTVTQPTSDVKNSDRDTEYLELAKDPEKNSAKLQEMVDEAAKEAGYTERMWHGAKKGKGFTIFNGWSYFTTDHAYAEKYTNRDPGNLYGVYAKTDFPFDTRIDLNAAQTFEAARKEYGMSKLNESGLPDWTDGYDIVDFIEENNLDYDSIVLDEGVQLNPNAKEYDERFRRVYSYVIRNSNQIKSADPVTYDDNGNVIPLSERFNTNNPDIRYSLREFEDGRRFVNVDIDQSLFDNLSLNEMNSMAEMVIRDKFKGKVVGIDNKAYVDVSSAKEYAHPAKWLGRDEREAKMRASAELDNLVDAGFDFRIDNGVPKNGNYDYFDVIFKVGKEYYQGTVNVQIVEKGRRFKDVTHIKNITQSIADSYGENPSVNSLRDNSMDTLSQPTSNVKKSERDYEAAKALEKVNEHLQNENEKLKEDLKDAKEMLKLQGKLTGGTMLKKSSADAISRRFAREFNIKGDTKQLSDMLYEAYSYIGSGDEVSWDEVESRLGNIVDWIDNNKTDAKRPLSAEATKILKTLNKDVALTESQKKEVAYLYGSYGDFRKGLFGRMNITDNAETKLDQWWQELADMYPEYFPADISEGDMPRALMEAIDNIQHDYDDDYFFGQSAMNDADIFNELYNGFWDVATLHTLADKNQKTINQLKAKHNERMQKLKESNANKIAELKSEQKKRIAQIRQEYRDRAEAKQKELLAEYNDRLARKKDSRDRTALRQQIIKRTGELTQLLRQKNGKKTVVPVELEEATIKALELVNMDNSAGETSPSMMAKLTALRDLYESVKQSTNPLLQQNFDQGIMDLIEDIRRDVGNTKLHDMTLDQLQSVYNLYSAVLATIRDYNKTFKANKAATIEELANKVMAETQTNPNPEERKLMAWMKKNGLSDFKPIYAMKYIGSDTLTELFNNVRKGEDTYAVDLSDARETFLFNAKEYGYNSWDMNESREFTSVDGKKFKLNLGDIMSLYAYSKRDQAYEHLTRGGIVFQDTIKQGLKQIKRNGAYLPSWGTIQKAISTLTPEQKAFVDNMQKYLSVTMGAKGNEVSRALYDIELYTEKNYFPLKSADQFLTKTNEATGDRKIKNSGFSKAVTPRASNPIVIQGFMDVWANHVADMSMYHAFVLPLEDFQRVFNYHVNGEQKSVRLSIGEAGTKYIQQMLEDLNGGARSASGTELANKLVGIFKKGAVFASASVVIQQPSALARAWAYIDPKYFGNKLDIKNHDVDWAECKKYAPVAMIKEMGYFDTNVGQSTVDWLKGMEYEGIKDKAKAIFTDSNYRDELISKAPALADEVTWTQIWKAAKAQVASEQHLEGEELLEAAGKLFTEAIVNTQVYDSVLSRSGIMRSKDLAIKMATAFMAEPTTSFNMLADAVIQAKRTGNTAQARRVIGSVVAQVALNSILVSIVYAARKDDDDKTYLEKYIGSLVGEFISGINPFAMVPYLKDVCSLLEGYDVERADMTAFADLIKSYKQLTSKELSPWRKVENFGGSIAQFAGIPLKNVMRDMRSLYNVVNDFMRGNKTSAEGIRQSIMEEITGKTANTQDKNALVKAIKKGDSSKIKKETQDWLNDKIKQGKTEKEARSAVMSALTSTYKPMFLEAYQKNDTAEMARIRKALNATGIYKDIVETTQDWIKSLAKAK